MKVKPPVTLQTIYYLGIKLEEPVEQILKKKGYATEMRQKLEGNSGALHEIDVLAETKQSSYSRM